MDERVCIAIDLKSFYASVECRERGLDPLDTNLVVADRKRSEKTICLAVSPSMKALGIPGRCRLFEAEEAVQDFNANRIRKAPGRKFTGSSWLRSELGSNPSLSLDYIAAPPRMALYIDYSTRIYRTYLKYIAPEDIHVYSIDEVFMDVTDYLSSYRLSPEELARTMILDVLNTTGITATAGIGTNLYLAKVAMDIKAKHVNADENGVRIAKLDEMSYRRELWSHRPLTDFWRVGHGYAKKLEEKRIFTMGDIARCSIGGDDDYYNEDLLYKLFGVNAELLIDHAWGWEPCTIKDIREYRPSSNSISSGQVLHCPYTAEKARLVVKEMADQLALDLRDKKLVSRQIGLYIGYDISNIGDGQYHGETRTDHYGRLVPRHSQGTCLLDRYTASSSAIIKASMEIFDRTVNKSLLIRRITISANNTAYEDSDEVRYDTPDLFDDTRKKEIRDDKEKKMQDALLDIKHRFGKNAILRGMSFEEGATARDRNNQIGGHHA